MSVQQYRLDLTEKDLRREERGTITVPKDTYKLEQSTVEGFYCFQPSQISYYLAHGHKEAHCSIVLEKPLISTCFSPIDLPKQGEETPRLLRSLMGCDDGGVYMVALDSEALKQRREMDTGRAMQHSLLGVSSRPDSINYIDNQLFFVASRQGDSYIAKIAPNHAKNEMGEDLDQQSHPNMKVMSSLQNFGPIQDLTVRGLSQKSEQLEIITCSGVGKDSRVKFVKQNI
jgi:hypothetical protein